MGGIYVGYQQLTGYCMYRMQEKDFALCIIKSAPKLRGFKWVLIARSIISKEIGGFLPALLREHSTFHSILFGRANKLILFLTETSYGYASRRLALSLRTMPGALMCGWFSRRASRVSIKICDEKYRNNESARQQIDVSKSMCARAIFALFPHILFSSLCFHN